mgnify:CR=1 FL=1
MTCISSDLSVWLMSYTLKDTRQPVDIDSSSLSKYMHSHLVSIPLHLRMRIIHSRTTYSIIVNWTAVIR